MPRTVLPCFFFLFFFLPGGREDDLFVFFSFLQRLFSPPSQTTHWFSPPSLLPLLIGLQPGWGCGLTLRGFFFPNSKYPPFFPPHADVTQLASFFLLLGKGKGSLLLFHGRHCGPRGALFFAILSSFFCGGRMTTAQPVLFFLFFSFHASRHLAGTDVFVGSHLFLSSHPPTGRQKNKSFFFAFPGAPPHGQFGVLTRPLVQFPLPLLPQNKEGFFSLFSFFFSFYSAFSSRPIPSLFLCGSQKSKDPPFSLFSRQRQQAHTPSPPLSLFCRLGNSPFPFFFSPPAGS